MAEWWQPGKTGDNQMEEETKTIELTPEVEVKEETVEVKKEEVIENKLVDELQKQTELAKEAKNKYYATKNAKQIAQIKNLVGSDLSRLESNK